MRTRPAKPTIQRSLLSLDLLPPETRLFAYTIALYVTFMIWGFLQERITSSTYSTQDTESTTRWDFPFVLNVCMAAGTYGTASLVEAYTDKVTNFPRKLFWRPALAATVASPLGYASLKYINYPLMVLTKSSKPVPIMLIGRVFFGQTYPWYKYVSVALLCIGISAFTFAQSTSTSSHAQSGASAKELSINQSSLFYALYGVLLIVANLSLDGYTNNEQDRLYSENPISAVQMMKQTNYWQFIFQAGYLLITAVVLGRSSELYGSIMMFANRPSLTIDVLLFCICASVGQVLIFKLVKEYGSLVWVTISVTRQLFTILLSVMIFGHSVNIVQWLGVALVFIGLGVDIVFTYLLKLKLDYGWDGKMKSLPDILTRSFSLSMKISKDGPRAYNSISSTNNNINQSKTGITSTATKPSHNNNNIRNNVSFGSLLRPSAVSRSSSANSDYIDIEQQIIPPSPSTGAAGRKSLRTSSVDKNKAD